MHFILIPKGKKPWKSKCISFLNLRKILCSEAADTKFCISGVEVGEDGLLVRLGEETSEEQSSLLITWRNPWAKPCLHLSESGTVSTCCEPGQLGPRAAAEGYQKGRAGPCQEGWRAFVGLLRGGQENVDPGAPSRDFPGRGGPEGGGAEKWPSGEEGGRGAPFSC